MLRFRYLASHKNNLIIDDFLVEGSWLALSVQVVGRQISVVRVKYSSPIIPHFNWYNNCLIFG